MNEALAGAALAGGRSRGGVADVPAGELSRLLNPLDGFGQVLSREIDAFKIRHPSVYAESSQQLAHPDIHCVDASGTSVEKRGCEATRTAPDINRGAVMDQDAERVERV